MNVVFSAVSLVNAFEVMGLKLFLIIFHCSLQALHSTPSKRETNELSVNYKPHFFFFCFLVCVTLTPHFHVDVFKMSSLSPN